MATQTTTTLPPAYQLPYLQYGLSQAKGAYDQGGQVVPFSQQSEQALQGTQQRATQGSPLVDAAQGYVQQGLQSAPTSNYGSASNPYASGPNMFGSPINPYLDQTFEKARLATQNGLSSEFARAGRNVDASQGLRSQQVNDLATGIYGGAYENERNRQLQYQSQLTGIGAQGYENAQNRQLQDIQGQRGLQQGLLGSVLPLANQDYVDLTQLRGVGSDVEGLAREYQQAPQQALDQYLGRVGGIPAGSTTSSPLYRNSTGAALGGALVGANIGSSVSSNPYAGLFGGLIGGAAGYFGG